MKTESSWLSRALSTAIRVPTAPLVILLPKRWACIGPYYVPNIHVDTYSVYTNNTICGPYRGFGILQASFVHESQMDQLAEKIGISPMEIRMRNCLKVGLSTSTGQVFQHGVGFEDTLKRAQEYMAEQDLYSEEMTV